MLSSQPGVPSPVILSETIYFYVWLLKCSSNFGRTFSRKNFIGRYPNARTLAPSKWTIRLMHQTCGYATRRMSKTWQSMSYTRIGPNRIPEPLEPSRSCTPLQPTMAYNLTTTLANLMHSCHCEAEVRSNSVANCQHAQRSMLL